MTNLARFVAASSGMPSPAPYHGLREELACKAAPTGFIRRLAGHSRRRIHFGTILLSAGLALFFLDFLV